MSAKDKIKHELKAILLAMVYFGIWIGMLLVIKDLILVEYKLALPHFTVALISALILAKTVVLLEHVSFGSGVKQQPAWVDVVLRTILYGIGVIIILLLERGIDGMREGKGFAEGIADSLKNEDAPHLWLNTLCVCSALLVYNIASVVRHHLGKGGLWKLFKVPLPESPATNADIETDDDSD